MIETVERYNFTMLCNKTYLKGAGEFDFAISAIVLQLDTVKQCAPPDAKRKHRNAVLSLFRQMAPVAVLPWRNVHRPQKSSVPQ